VHEPMSGSEREFPYEPLNAGNLEPRRQFITTCMSEYVRGNLTGSRVISSRCSGVVDDYVISWTGLQCALK
jgi:hypothetical protein